MSISERSRADSEWQAARGFCRELTAVDPRPHMLNDHAPSVAEHLVTR